MAALVSNFSRMTTRRGLLLVLFVLLVVWDHRNVIGHDTDGHHCPHCRDDDDSKNRWTIYERGGSAQAYKPNAPIKIKGTVCDATSRRKVSRWPLSRSTTKTSSPLVKVNGQLYTCRQTKEVDGGMWCSPPSALDGGAKVEVWQPRPDGTFSSLTPGIQDGVCRSTILPSNTGAFSFTTFAPGSTGMLGGLGPHGWDCPPFGPSYLHFLITMPHHAISLAQVHPEPDLPFYGPDLRGPSMVGAGTSSNNNNNNKSSVVRVSSFERHDVSSFGEEIELSLDFYLYPNKVDDDTSVDLEKALCRSTFYGFPGSFFTEPISICHSNVLHYFPL